MNIKNCLNNKTGLSYAGLIFVVFLWGVSPLITLKLYDYYSPTFRTFVADLVLVIFYLIISIKKLKQLNLKYLKVVLTFGTFNSLANLLQKIGLQYTTPAKYAFLENLSCIIVPFVTFMLVRKKPTVIKIISCFLCLASVFVLNGVFKDGFSFGIGEILCALAGIFYGVNIAGTGVHMKDLDTGLYLTLQFTLGMIMSLATSLVFAYVSWPGETTPIQPLKFSFNIWHLTLLVGSSLIISGLGWLIRVNSLKYVDATVVGVIMPFSAVVTSVASVIVGTDRLSLNLVLGGILGVIAIILSNVGDKLFSRKKKVHEPEQVAEKATCDNPNEANSQETETIR